MRVVHVISGLYHGGAEMMLYRLLARLRDQGYECEVVSLLALQPFAADIRALGVPVRTLRVDRALPSPLLLGRLARLLARARPDVVHAWMYHACLAAGLASRWGPRAPVVWALRQSNVDPGLNKARTVWTAKACAALSKTLPDRIVCNSEAARRVHLGLGFAGDRMEVIPNGFDLDAFRPDAAAGPSVRAEFGVPRDAPLVGLAGRLDPQKDHRTFARAAGVLAAARPDVHFLLFGRGVAWSDPSLASWLGAAGLDAGRCHLAGHRDDVARLTAALDVATSSSLGESFPNTVGEAMACGVPCAVTDVGDSASIVGDTGLVVPPGDPAALAGACTELLDLPPAERRARGARARDRIGATCGIDRVVARYDGLYRDLAGSPARRAPSPRSTAPFQAP